jgi:hypothetical protein
MPPYTYNNDMFIDGGIIDNFPIDKVKLENRSKTIGICSRSYSSVWSNLEQIIKNKEFISYMLEIIKIAFTKHGNYLVNNYISINDSINSAFDFQLDSNGKENLINSGYTQSLEQIDRIIKNMLKEQINVYNMNNKYSKNSKYNEI